MPERPLPVGRGARPWTSEAPGAVAELRDRGVEIRPGAGRRPVPRPGGRALGAADSPRRRGRDRRAITGRLAELVAPTSRNRRARADLGARPVERRRALRGGGHRRRAVTARATVLATGGGAALWRRTTNPWGAIGAGPVLAHAAGAELADLEFCQFHPTALALPGTEGRHAADRGASRRGRELLDAAGRRFTDELAPAIRSRRRSSIAWRPTASDHVLLDLRPIPAERFPNVFAGLPRGGPRPAERSRSRSPRPPTT